MRTEQTVAYGTQTIQPATIGTLPAYTSSIPAKISDSVFRQADAAKKIFIGNNTATVDMVAADSAVVVGESASARGARSIAIGDNAGQIGSAGVAGVDGIRIGTQTYGRGANSIAIGTSAGENVAGNADGIAIGRLSKSGTDGIAIGRSSQSGGANGSIAIGLSADAFGGGNAGGSNIAIGHGANFAAGTGGLGIAIGNLATVNAASGGHIAIGSSASVTAGNNNGIALGSSASCGHGNGIAIGQSATTSQIGEVVFGDINNGPVTLFTVRPAAGVPVRHRNSATGWVIIDLAKVNDIFKVDESAVADDMRLLLWDVTAGALKRVSRNAVDTAGVGFRSLRIPN